MAAHTWLQASRLFSGPPDECCRAASGRGRHCREPLFSRAGRQQLETFLFEASDVEGDAPKPVFTMGSIRWVQSWRGSTVPRRSNRENAAWRPASGYRLPSGGAGALHAAERPKPDDCKTLVVFKIEDYKSSQAAPGRFLGVGSKMHQW